MATAGERLVALRARIRAFDEAVMAERIEVIGMAFTEGAVRLPVQILQSVAQSCHEKAAECHRKAAENINTAKAASDTKAAKAHENDGKLVEPESLELDGHRREKYEDGTVLWRGPRDWPGIPRRQLPMTHPDGAQAGTAGGGGGGSSARERPLAQERRDAQTWETYYKWIADKDEWIKRQRRRGWLVGQFLLSTVLNNPETRRVFRDSGVGRAAELLADEWPDSATDSSA